MKLYNLIATIWIQSSSQNLPSENNTVNVPRYLYLGECFVVCDSNTLSLRNYVHQSADQLIANVCFCVRAMVPYLHPAEFQGQHLRECI